MIIILLLPALAEAQLTAPGMRAVRYTSYPSLPAVKDPVFIYCNDSGSQKGTLVAASPGGTGLLILHGISGATRQKASAYLLKPKRESIPQHAANLGEGGYRVVISGGFDTSLIGWIFIDRPFSSAKLQNRTCDYVALNGEAALILFITGIPLTGFL